ncbi:MAG: metallophosphoesterase [Abditibacteriales bacterium]|nr:metallophosphoesterase [Abditibacteriales bacterium]MDW8367867.1 metallophosphoesterase [Abditibacteriales bacterium]
MKLGVMSDSHDHVPNVRKAVELFCAEGVGLVVHAGDFVAPFALDPLRDLPCKVVAVLGNNDGEKVGLQKRCESMGFELQPKMATAQLGGRKIAVVHEPEPVEGLARSGLFDIVVYGHTHKIDIEKGKTLILNPGEVGGWVTGRATVAVVDLDTLEVALHDL